MSSNNCCLKSELAKISNFLTSTEKTLANEESFNKYNTIEAQIKKHKTQLEEIQNDNQNNRTKETESVIHTISSTKIDLISLDKKIENLKAELINLETMVMFCL